MPKKIVICCDGTGNEFGAQNSNVIKLYKTLVCDASQIAYYHPGVGTMGARSALIHIGKWWTKLVGLAFGYGISDNIADAFQFLMRNYDSGDRVYIFGFSRGAYTARALCGMLHIVGLLTRGNEGLIPYAIRMIKNKYIDFAVAADFKNTFSRECKPHFVGVWDTVSSVGWVYNAVHFPFTQATKNPDLQIVRHAVSIDERRAFFRENLFGTPHDVHQDIREVWSGRRCLTAWRRAGSGGRAFVSILLAAAGFHPSPSYTTPSKPGWRIPLWATRRRIYQLIGRSCPTLVLTVKPSRHDNRVRIKCALAPSSGPEHSPLVVFSRRAHRVLSPKFSD